MKRINMKTVFTLGMLIFSAPAFSHDNLVVIPMRGEGGKTFASCKEILDAGFSSENGVYAIDTVGDGIPHVAVYCDMGTGTTYERFAFGNHNSTYTGYTLTDLATWQNAAFQQAYIWYHNSNDGLRNLDEGYSSNNCCIYFPNHKALFWGGKSLYPYNQSGAQRCNPSGGYRDGRYNVSPNTGFIKPLPTDYFTSNPVTEVIACSNSNNPGVFVKSYQ